MIFINLLPEEFRVVVKPKQDVPVKKLASVAGLIFLLLTVYFYIDYFIAKGKLSKMEVSWQKVQPQSLELSALEQEVQYKLKPEKAFLEKFVTTDRPLTHLLAWASEYLPESAWLSELTMERKGEAGRFFVKGLALPSKESSSIEFIEAYLHSLKKEMPDADLSLTTTRRKMEGVELTQFIANFKWGEEKKRK